MDSTISILNFSVSFLLVGGRGNTKGEYKGGIHNHFTIPE